VGWIPDISAVQVKIDGGVNLVYGTDFVINVTSVGYTTDYANYSDNAINGSQNYHASKELFNYELELIDNDKLVGTNGGAPHSVQVTYDYDVFEEYRLRVDTFDGSTTNVQNLKVYNNATNEELSLSDVEGYEIIPVQYYTDQLTGLSYSNYYVSINGANIDYQLRFEYEYEDETAIQNFVANFQVGSHADDKIQITIPGTSIKQLDLRDVSVETIESSKDAMDTIDTAITTVLSYMSRLGSDVSRLTRTNSFIMRRIENAETSISYIKSSDMARNAMEMFKAKLLEQKNLKFLNYSNFSSLNPSVVINKTYN
jgi:flagellin-like hook-associated protein FlgL